MGNRNMRAVEPTIDFANAIADSLVPQEEAQREFEQREGLIANGDAEADAFADAIQGAIEEAVPTTFASMLVDMGKSLLQMHEERVKLDEQLIADLRRIDEEALRQRAEVELAYRMAATEIGVRLQGVAKAIGA